MSRTNKPIFVITRALPGHCGACDLYSANVDKVFRQLLKQDGRMNILDLTIEDGNKIYVTSNKKAPIHPDIYSWVVWWPSFILFSQESWNDHKSKLQGSIFGGKLDEQSGTVVEIPGKYDFKDPESLMQWVKDTLNSNIFSKDRRIVSYNQFKEDYNNIRTFRIMPSKQRISTSDF